MKSCFTPPGAWQKTNPMLLTRLFYCCWWCSLIGALRFCAHAADAGIILHHGKVVTVDAKFSLQEAIALQADRIIEVGPNTEVLKHRGPQTEVVDLHGKLVLPGLIDSHAHPASA